MTSRWILRGALAALAAAIGVTISTAAGAPFLAALIGMLAGVIALALLLAPARVAPEAEPVDETPALDPLPNAVEVISAVDHPVMIVRGRRIVAANPAARKVLGDHIQGVDVRLAIRHPAAAERLMGDSTQVTRTELVGLDERRWEMTISPLGLDSRLVRLADRSEAHASEQMRVDFVANASHELRTPLATLIGFSETLHDDPGADPKTRQRFLKIMADEARRMQQLIDDLISLSRIEAERYTVPSEPVPLLPLLEEIRAACGQLAAEKSSRIEIEAPAEPPVVPGDRSQLLQLLRNLAVNALKYGRPGEPVAIRFERPQPDILVIVVADRGDGIAAEHLPRLTERFYRVDPGRSRAMGGTGLGLAIVKHITLRHRGRLDIQSKVGEGTDVRVHLPALVLGAMASNAMSSNSHDIVTGVSPNHPSDVTNAR